MYTWQLLLLVQLRQRFRQAIIQLQLEIPRSLLRVIIPNQQTLLLSEIMLRQHRVIMQSRCQQEIILHLHRVIIRSQVHQKNIRHQARQEHIRHQAEVATVVAAGTVAVAVAVAVLEVADQVHQATDHDK